MNPLQLRTALTDTIINVRFGDFSKGFETRPVNAQGGDETFTVAPNDDGTWSIQSPNGKQWLTINEAGQREWRDVSTTPGGWEKFTRAGNVLTEVQKDGIARPLVQYIGSGL
jgi:hypothetical protein